MGGNTIGNKLEEIRELLDIETPNRTQEKIEYAWYVGATGNDESGNWTDFSDIYISEGRWENGWDERFIDEVKSMKVGDRIAIKSTSKQKSNLPFQNNGKWVGFADIKAVGTITFNPGDGKNIQVSWTKLDASKRWYSFCGFLRDTVNLVKANEGYTKAALLRFTFADEQQDYSLCEEKYAAEPTESAKTENVVTDDLSLDELGAILKKMCDEGEKVGKKIAAIYNFGLLYGKCIGNTYSAAEIVKTSGIEQSFDRELQKSLKLYATIENEDFGLRFADSTTIENNAENIYDSVSKEPEKVIAEPICYETIKGSAINKIFFGTPGCGKSYHIEHDILGKDTSTGIYTGDYKKENIIRTTFYQDYSNTDFVGQILPKIVKGQNGTPDTVEYIFNPGPFTLALIQAISNPSKKVALVIEEINRGNAPAIFGDVFQLLDRDSNSISEYGIVNVSLRDYLNDYEFVVDGQKRKYIFTEIKIPGNMDIFATMNTSDQNVYTLDTAFVRRWDKEKIKNSFADCKFAGKNVPGMNYTWQEFVTAINNHIAKHLEDLQVNEDKQIGVFFVKESLLGSTPEKFAYKVFDYLWSDVAKLDHGIFFNYFDTLEALITAYEKDGVGVFKTGIFDKKETPQTVEEDENNE